MPHPKPVLVVSDIHLGAVPPATEVAFREFLRFAATESSGLLINGDLFDVWLATRHFVVRHHVRVLAALADLVESGLPVWFVGGNHDFLELGGEFLRDEIGMQVLEEPARLRLAGFETLVIHGDGVQPGKTVYAKRHPVLRSTPVRRLLQAAVHVDRIHDAIARWSGTRTFVERHLRGEDTGPKTAAPRIEEWSLRELATDPRLDLVLAGHSHLPAWKEVSPGRYYVNTGDWISHMTYGVIGSRNEQPALRRWPGQELVAGGRSEAGTDANAESQGERFEYPQRPV